MECSTWTERASVSWSAWARSPRQNPARASRRLRAHFGRRSVVDLPLLGSIDVGRIPRFEEKCGHVLCEEFSGLWVHHIQPVVVDQHGLLAKPIAPALLTDL